MSCPSCGTEAPAWAAQCPACGASLSSEPPSAGSGWSSPLPPSEWPTSSPQPPGYGPPTYAQPGYGPPSYPPPGYGAAPYDGGYTPPVGQLAGWWHRVGATLIDAIVLGALYVILLLVLHVIGLLITLVAAGGYQGYLLSSRGQTLGNMAVSTRVVDANSGGPISFWRAVGRWAITIPLAIIPLGELLDVLWPLWDRRNQTLHDKVVATVVVRT